MNAEGEATESGGIVSSVIEARERAEDWYFLDANRLIVAGTLLGLVLAVMFTLRALGFVPLGSVGSMYYVFGGLIGGNLTLISLVVSMNQLILSRQLGAPGEVRDRIDATTEYRTRIAETTDSDVAPVVPTDFATVLLENTRRDVQRLGGLSAGADDERYREDVDGFVTELTEHLDSVLALLSRTGVGVGAFSALSAILTTNYGTRIRDAHWLENEYGEDLSEEGYEILEGIIDRLQQIDIARQYFKTLYFQSELAYLSRVLLYVGFIAEIGMGILLFGMTTTGEAGYTAPFPPEFLIVGFVVGLAPLAVLFAYVIRIAMVTQRTAAITPFTSPKQEPGLSIDDLDRAAPFVDQDD